MDLIEKNITLDVDLSTLIEEILEHDLLQFNSDEQLKTFTELYENLHNNSRLWLNAGFKPTEMIEQVDNSED